MNEQLKVIISAEIGKFKQNIEKAKKAIKDFVEEEDALDQFTEEFSKVGDVSKKALATMGTAIIGATAALFALASAGKEHAQNQAILATSFETAGGSADTAKNVYNDLFRVLGDSGKATEAAQHLAKLTSEEEALSEWTTICQGVYATFGDTLPIESLTEAVNHSAKLGDVQGTLADALEWSGVNVDEFNDKLFECNNEAEREKLIRETLGGLYNEAAANYETTGASILEQNEAQAKMNETMAALNEALAPVMAELKIFGAEILAELAPQLKEFADDYGPQIKEVLSKIADAIGAVLGWIVDNWELVSTLAVVIASICAALTVFSTVMTIVNAVMAASPVTWIVMAIVAAIAALVAIIVVVIKYWDEIKEATRAVWEPMVEFFKGVWDSISKVFIAAWDMIKAVWDKVEPYFTYLWEQIKNAFTVTGEILGAAFKAAWGIIKAIWDSVTSYFKAIFDTIANIFSFVGNMFKGNFGEAWENVKNIFSAWGDYFRTLWDSIKKIFGSVGTFFSSVFISAWNGIKKAFGNVVNFFKDIVDRIKGLFKFEWSLPKLKVPKFAITPAGWKIGDLLQGVIPKLSIAWNARGGVFDKPTIFSYGNSLQGLGENGAEAVVPLENNTEWLDKIADKLASKMGIGTPVTLEVDGKVFAQTAIHTINQLTRQQGKLSLNLI